MSGTLNLQSSTDCIKLGKEFVEKYYQISNTRPDLLYRFYSPNSRIKISETIRGKKKCMTVSGSTQQEIRFILTNLLEKVQTTLIDLCCPPSKDAQRVLLVHGLFRHEAARVDHYFTQTFALAESEEIAIATVTLQIFSHNLKRYLMKALQTVIKDSQLQVNIHYPQSVDTKVRSKVCPAEESLLDENVASLTFVPYEACSSTETNSMKLNRSDLNKDAYIATDTAREAMSDKFRTQGWDAFSKAKPREIRSEACCERSSGNGDYGGDASFDTPIIKQSLKDEAGLKQGGFFLNCFKDAEKSQEIKATVDFNWSLSEKTDKTGNGAYLRIFGYEPIPDGPAVEWDLSQDAVLTQLRKYQDGIDRLQMHVPKQRSRSRYTQVEWHRRTVYLDDLPVDVHPESLRRAFETMFGEIENDNGIIIASAKRSSIAYIVFKSLESAKAVGLADLWIKGSKLIIQKYTTPFVDYDSIVH